MKRHIVTAAFISWLTGVCATAATVNHDAAYQYATEFLSERGLSATLSPVNLSAISRSATAAQTSAVHIFNIGEGDGFVIIAGDDRARKILAYSDTGSIETATMPEACRAWVEQYADEISSLPSEDISCNYKSINPETHRKQTTQIAPLLKSRWDQKLPYNMLCPVDVTTGLQCVTGCVATATAQVMYYHRYPSQATGTVTYEDKSQNVTRTLDFSTIAPFEWNSMSD
ncbi:MAG: C10 family peptidase, partial [Duncaniella sp.]|nr:C10 family peptidase [Duncaniella sp.]